ncbi:SDR family NAD(P)-dependent oxidoreductase [Membranihabitans maritimus]|uniref:SDR family NAD(P)-dependent oxidoreductase n=1 Tax=Membranihabitans maritimus TaxID=2904244 RepID=UPI001F29CDF5|nr:SDR family oxidoreductase [Membranihabitans maritimus]
MNKEKVAIITGAAGGIGQETARMFCQKGYHLLLVDMATAPLEALKSQLQEANIKNEIKVFTCDLSKTENLHSIVEECRSFWGRIDVLVNNAVWRTHDTMRTISIDDWERTLKVSITAPAFLAKWVAELMEEKNIRGVIVNISSIMSQRAGGTSPAYVASKGAIESLTYELASLYGPSGIRAVGVAPGNVITPLSKDFTTPTGENISKKMEENMTDQTPLMRSAEGREIASAICWLSSEESSFVTGTILQVDGGFSHGFNHYSLKKIQFPKEF